MRDNLPKRRPWVHESAIVNLDSSDGEGTHWVAYKKEGDKVEYFDSYGDMRPPLELQRYLTGSLLSYNKSAYQSVNSDSDICGHLSLAFLLSK
jgi:hypothetical protein